MDWRALVCASCGHPVVEARCPVCREMSEEFRRASRPGLDVVLGVVALIVLLAVLVTLLQR
jgi:hypothetical protein